MGGGVAGLGVTVVVTGSSGLTVSTEMNTDMFYIRYDGNSGHILVTIAINTIPGPVTRSMRSFEKAFCEEVVLWVLLMSVKTASCFSDGDRSTDHIIFTLSETAQVVVLNTVQLVAYAFAFPVKICTLLSSTFIFAGH